MTKKRIEELRELALGSDNANQLGRELQKCLDEIERLRDGLKQHDNWMRMIYPPTIFVGLPDCDEGVKEVVRLRELAQKLLEEDAE